MVIEDFLKNNKVYYPVSLVVCFLLSLVFKYKEGTILPGNLFMPFMVLVLGCCIYYAYRKKIKDKRLIIVLIFFVLLSFLLYVLCNYSLDNRTAMVIMTLVLLSICGLLVFSDGSLELNKKIFVFLFLTGFVIRLLYVLYTSWNDRQHDIGNLVEKNGHSGYMLYLLNNKHLPDFDPTTVWQFYHPPLHHFLAAVWMFLHQIFSFDTEALLESVQFLTMFYSLSCTKIFNEVLEEYSIDGKYKTLAFGLFVLCPEMIFLSGQINNDVLSFVFIMLIFLWTVRWIKNRDIKNIVPIAFSFGFGMMSKLSVVSMAFPVGIIFAYFFFRSFKEKNTSSLFKQYVVFLLICAPIGLWWSVRCYLKWDMPLNYVPRFSDDSWQYIGEGYVNPLSRLLRPKFTSIFTDKDPLDYNMIIALFKTWLFGEYDFRYSSIYRFICYPLFISNFLIIMYSIVGYFKNLRNHKIENVFMNIVMLISMVSYIYFCYAFPHLCTMHIRYSLIIIPIVHMLFVMNAKENDMIRTILALINVVSSILMFLFVV